MSSYGPLVTLGVKPPPPWKRNQLDLNDTFPVTPSPDWFQNSYGHYRWHKIRAAYFDKVIDIPLVVDIFKEWRDASEFFMLDGYNQDLKHIMSIFVKASKRGNCIYKKLMKQKFSFLDSLPPIHFFCEEWGVKRTPMLFITLTVDPKKYDIDSAYEDIAVQLNRFETLLRQKYGSYKCAICGHKFVGRKKCPKCKAFLKDIVCVGSFVKFRVWEIHENGYPHCHVVYYFHDAMFHVFEHFNKKKEGKKQRRTFRIVTKHRDAISKMWPMGQVDIQAVSDTLGAFSEVKKYITKNIWSKKADLTNAMLTLYRKQAYSVSTCDYVKQVEKLNLSGSIKERSDEVSGEEISSPSSISDMIKPDDEIDIIMREKDLDRESAWKVHQQRKEIKQLDKIMAKPSRSIKERSNEIFKHLDEWLRKDFVGSIWGATEYIELYESRTRLKEPSGSDLVKETMCNYNIEHPEIVKWEFVGFVLGDDLREFLPKFDDDDVFHVVDPPPMLYSVVDMRGVY